MNNLFHLAALSLLLLTFSGISSFTSGSAMVKSMNNVDEVNFRKGKEESAEAIPWSARRMLTWEDFQSAPRQNTDAVASTSTSLGISYQVRNGVLNYEITCNFSKLKSWGSLKTDYILAHEQGHFDITEIFARKLNQKLEEYQFNRKTYRQDINRIYQSIVAEKEAMQQAYDGETDHSRKRRRQNEWMDRIEQILEETEPYAVYP